MDPLSITVGVLSLLAASISTGTILKDFYDGASLANTKVRGLLTEVDGFTEVLRLMKSTFEQKNIQVSLRATGHISNHLANLATSIQDGQNTLAALHQTLEKVNKSVSVLDGMRKHLRLKSAADGIAMYQQQIRSYRDTMHLTLQTIILWNQVSFRESTDQILPNLDYVHHSIRRIASDINSQISTLQLVSETPAEDLKLQNLKNLRSCVKSSATIVSSASSTLSVGRGSEQISVTYASDFGDCFPPEPAEPMRRWISSNSDFDYEPGRGAYPSMTGPREPKGKGLELIEEGSDAGLSDQSESDSELEAEIVDSLLRQGKDKLASQDYEAAENRFRNCLSRVDSSQSSVSVDRVLESRAEIVALLLTACRHQEKWDAARSLLLEEIAREGRVSSKDSPSALANTLLLVEVLIKKFEYKEALSLGRRALKGYRKLGPSGTSGVQNSLELLCRISKASGNFDQEDAYAAILSDILRHASSPVASATKSKQDTVRKPTRHPSIGSSSSLESPPAQGLAINRLDGTPLASGSSWKTENQPLSPSTSTSVSTKSSSRDGLSSRQSRDPPSPYTEYSFTSSNPQDEPFSPKDLGVDPHDEESNFAADIPDLRQNYGHSHPSSSGFFKPVQPDDGGHGGQKRAAFISELNRQIPAIMGSGRVNRSVSLSRNTEPRLSSVSIESEGSTASSASKATSKAPPPPPPHKPKHLRHGSNPLPEQILQRTPTHIHTNKFNNMTDIDQASPTIRRQSTDEFPSTNPFRKGKGIETRQDTSPSEFEPKVVSPQNIIVPLPTWMSPPGNPSGKNERAATRHLQPQIHQVPIARPSQRSAQVVVETPVEPIKSPPVQPPTSNSFTSSLDDGNRRPAARPIQPQTHETPFDRPSQRSAQVVVQQRTEPIEQRLVTPERRSAIDLFDSGVVELPVEAPRRHDDTAVDWVAFYADQDAKEQRVKRLVEMGFDRTKAAEALELNKQDLTIAANYLAVGLLEDGEGAESEIMAEPQVTGVTEVRDEESDPEDIYNDNSNSQPSRPPSDPPEYATLAPTSSFVLPVSSTAKPLSKEASSPPTIETDPPSSSEKSIQPGGPALVSDFTEPERPTTRRSHGKKVSFGSSATSNQIQEESIGKQPERDSQEKPTGESSRPFHNPALFDISNTPRNATNGEGSASQDPKVLPSGFTTQLAPPINQFTKISPPGFSTPLAYASEKEVVFQPPSPNLDTQWSIPDSKMGNPALTFAKAPWPQELPRRMVAICGHVFCGKTSLISVFSKGIFPEAYNPSPLECTRVHQETSDKIVEFYLWDLGNDIEDDFYADKHFVIICFSISDPDSLRLAQEKYVPLVKANNSTVRYMLVGLKKDRRQNREYLSTGVQESIVTPAEGQVAAVKMKAVSYMECSAKTGEGVVELFDAVAGLAMMPDEKLTRMKSFRNLFGKKKRE